MKKCEASIKLTTKWNIFNSVDQKVPDGYWRDWEDIDECQPTRYFETKSGSNSSCGPGLKGQRKKCERELGGKQCPVENSGSNPDGVRDVMFRTTSCETSPCPGKVDLLVMS